MEFAIWGVKKNSKWIFNKPKNTPYLRSIFETSVVSGKERTGHPTQKSLELMEQIILIHTNERDTIIDPFMGSGTTGVAALKNKRNFIGIENNDEYYSIALKRLEEATNIK
jgi:DNA modification methylase